MITQVAYSVFRRTVSTEPCTWHVPAPQVLTATISDLRCELSRLEFSSGFNERVEFQLLFVRNFGERSYDTLSWLIVVLKLLSPFCESAFFVFGDVQWIGVRHGIKAATENK
jgi:hypothetical protein